MWILLLEPLYDDPPLTGSQSLCPSLWLDSSTILLSIKSLLEDISMCFFCECVFLLLGMDCLREKSLNLLQQDIALVISTPFRQFLGLPNNIPQVCYGSKKTFFFGIHAELKES